MKPCRDCPRLISINTKGALCPKCARVIYLAALKIMGISDVQSH
jgi:ABC-type ATPase with predicted acetyltransferase domain